MNIIIAMNKNFLRVPLLNLARCFVISEPYEELQDHLEVFKSEH